MGPNSSTRYAAISWDEAMKKILVVEDVELNQDLVVQLLEDNYEVLTAVDGAEGLQIAEREHIALSAHAMMGDAEKALQSGCDDYLSKPLDEDLLFAKLAKFLGE